MVAISVFNRTIHSFKATTVCFSEIETSAEKYWNPNSSHLIIRNNEKIQIGKLIHCGDLANSANVVVTVILSLFGDRLEPNTENLIALKARIKGSIKSTKIYSYASSFPTKYSLTKPCWRKGNAKNIYFCNIFDKIFEITYFCTWNNSVVFVIEEHFDRPIFTYFSQLSTKDEVIDEIFENQWKNNIFGEATYSHNNPRMSCSRPSFSSINGMYIGPRHQIMPPTSLWIWKDDWHIDTDKGDENGWVYSDSWYSSIESASGASKFRFRRWIRTRIQKNNNLILENENKLNFIYEKVKIMTGGLHDMMQPFHKKIKREVESFPLYFDFSTLKAIPSPKLRRQLIHKIPLFE